MGKYYNLLSLHIYISKPKINTTKLKFSSIKVFNKIKTLSKFLSPTYRSKFRVIQRSRIYTCYLMVIHPCICQILQAYVNKQVYLAQTQIHCENIILILRLKVKVIQKSCMYTTHHPQCITQYDYAKGQKRLWPKHKAMS